MKNILKVSCIELGKPELSPVFESLQKLSNAENIFFCIIGALGRDIWFRSSTLEKSPSRLTKDIDIAILTLKIEQWKEAKNG